MADKIDLKEFHPKIQQLFLGKESKLRMIDDWVLMETLGMGGYSKVKLGLHKKEGTKAALKIMFADQSGKMSESKKKQLMRELNVMKKIEHDNVIKLISYNANASYPEANGKSTPCIATALEFAAGGELFDYLMYTGCFDAKATRSYFQQLINGLEAMHSVGIAHRDLKPENLLMDSSFTLKIADFGFATEFKDLKTGKESLMATPCGTKNYLAPEFWKGLKYSYKCDIFAAGIILFTTFAGFPPFMEAQPNDWWWDKYSIALKKLKRANELRHIIKHNPQLKSDPNCAELKEQQSCLMEAKKRMQLFWKAHQKKRVFDDDDFKDIALNLIHPNPDKRMEIAKIKEHKWYKGAIYSKDELKLYLTKRVRTVLTGRAKKIRNLMKEQQQNREKQKYSRRPLKENGDESGKDGVFQELSALQQRMAEIDPNNDFDQNIQCVADGIFPNSMFQFFTFASCKEMAARIEKVCIKQSMSVSISPKENLITITCGFIGKDFVLKDGATKKSPTEEITFCAKQFALDAIDKSDKTPLSEQENIKYLISFKRLQGAVASYTKVMNNFVSVIDFAEAIDWSEFDLEKDEVADTDKDDEKEDNAQ